MVLIVGEGCQFCEEFKELNGLVIAKFLPGDHPMLELLGQRIPQPIGIVGLPTLLDGDKVYVGRDPVRKRLEEVRESL